MEKLHDCIIQKPLKCKGRGKREIDAKGYSHGRRTENKNS